MGRRGSTLLFSLCGANGPRAGTGRQAVFARWAHVPLSAVAGLSSLRAMGSYCFPRHSHTWSVYPLPPRLSRVPQGGTERRLQEHHIGQEEKRDERDEGWGRIGYSRSCRQPLYEAGDSRTALRCSALSLAALNLYKIMKKRLHSAFVCAKIPSPFQKTNLQ